MGMKSKKSVFQRILILSLFSMLMACTNAAPPPPGKEASVAPAVKAEESSALMDGQLPVRYQQPTFLLNEKSADEALGLAKGGDITIPVGADISSTAGPVPLRDILKRLAALKGMNISWGSDVDQFAMVDFDIKAEDDFFQAIDNILRQVEYFHDVQNNTIIVKFRDTRKFHIAMPFLTSTYNTGVGGDVLGASGDTKSNIIGNMQLTSEKNTFDIWSNIQGNLDQILDIWDETAPVTETAEASTRRDNEGDSDSREKTRVKAVRVKNKNAKGYYTIDKPIGLITVTAPKPLLEKITLYVDNLKAELFRQISIEAKIVEVELTESSEKGVNWDKILNDPGINFKFQMFGNGGVLYPGSNRVVSELSMTSPLNMVLKAIETQGETKVLANPKLSIMNGQPAMISIGDNITYIESVESKTDGNTGTVTYTVNTSSILSGLGMSVVAVIMENNEIVLSLTPVTSKLQPTQDGEDIRYETFGIGDFNKVGLPKVQLREMNTVVRVKDGETLVIGGLIDNAESNTDLKVPFFGKLPLINRLFKNETKSKSKKELVILLQPKIIS